MELNPNHDSGCGFFGWFAKDFLRKFCESSAKAADDKVSMEASSPHSTFAATSQGNVVNNETLLFPGGISQHGLPFALGCLSDISHSYCLHADRVRLSSTKADSCNPAKDKRGVREHIFSFAKSGRLQIKELRSTATYIRTYQYINIHSQTYTYIYNINIHVHTRTHIYARMHTYADICIHIRTYICMQIHTDTYICIQIHSHINIHTCSYIYMHLHLHTYTRNTYTYTYTFDIRIHFHLNTHTNRYIYIYIPRHT